jgi:hypothetical protein
VKPGDHPFLFDRLIEAFDQERVTVLTWKEVAVNSLREPRPSAALLL